MESWPCLQVPESEYVIFGVSVDMKGTIKVLLRTDAEEFHTNRVKD